MLGLLWKVKIRTVSDAAIVLSGLHCDVELTKTADMVGGQLDFGHGDVQKVSFGVEVWTSVSGGTHIEALDFMPVEPDTNVDRLDGNSRYLRRGTDPQPDGPACSGTVRLLCLQKDVFLFLTPPRRKEGAYERLGIFHPEIGGQFDRIVKPPKMPNWVRRSSITPV